MLTHARSSSLDELVIDALSNPSESAVLPTDSYFKIEVIREDDLDVAVTGRFVRWSAPFDKQWFDDADDAVAAIAATEEPAVERAGQWTWLAISVAVAGLAVAIAEYVL